MGSRDREGKVDNKVMGAVLHWGTQGACREHSFPSHPTQGQGSWVFIHQLLSVIGHGLPAQVPPALPGRYLTPSGSWEQLLRWIHKGSSPRPAFAPQLCGFGPIADSV